MDWYEGAGRGLHPIPEEWRRADRERDQLSREIEGQLTAEEHAQEPDVYYLMRHTDPPEGWRVANPELGHSRGFIEYDAGSWWFWPRRLERLIDRDLPRRSEVAEKYGQDEPKHELDVVDVEEGMVHGREHLAWILAGEELGR